MSLTVSPSAPSLVVASASAACAPAPDPKGVAARRDELLDVFAGRRAKAASNFRLSTWITAGGALAMGVGAALIGLDIGRELTAPLLANAGFWTMVGGGFGVLCAATGPAGDKASAEVAALLNRHFVRSGMPASFSPAARQAFLGVTHDDHTIDTVTPTLQVNYDGALWRPTDAERKAFASAWREAVRAVPSLAGFDEMPIVLRDLSAKR